MATLDDVNRLVAAGVSDFPLLSYTGGQLVVGGGFDLCYYHDIGLTFHGVERINCPTALVDPVFRGEGAEESGRRYGIEADGRRFEVAAGDVTVAVGEVYHYDRGGELRPGERIAEWVKRGS